MSLMIATTCANGVCCAPAGCSDELKKCACEAIAGAVFIPCSTCASTGICCVMYDGYYNSCIESTETNIVDACSCLALQTELQDEDIAWTTHFTAKSSYATNQHCIEVGCPCACPEDPEFDPCAGYGVYSLVEFTETIAQRCCAGACITKYRTYGTELDAQYRQLCMTPAEMAYWAAYDASLYIFQDDSYYDDLCYPSSVYIIDTYESSYIFSFAYPLYSTVNYPPCTIHTNTGTSGFDFTNIGSGSCITGVCGGFSPFVSCNCENIFSHSEFTNYSYEAHSCDWSDVPCTNEPFTYPYDCASDINCSNQPVGCPALPADVLNTVTN